MHRPRLLGFFPKNILLVQDDLSGGVERVLDFNMLLHSAGAVSVSQLVVLKQKNRSTSGRYAGMGRAAMRCNAVWAAERMSPSPIDGAERNNRVTVEVIAVLSVHVERPVAHALADGPHVVEAGDVHAVSGNNLGVSKSQSQRASRSIAIGRKASSK